MRFYVAAEIALTGRPVSPRRLTGGVPNRLAEPGHALALGLELASTDRHLACDRKVRDVVQRTEDTQGSA